MLGGQLQGPRSKFLVGQGPEMTFNMRPEIGGAGRDSRGFDRQIRTEEALAVGFGCQGGALPPEKDQSVQPSTLWIDLFPTTVFAVAFRSRRYSCARTPRRRPGNRRGESSLVRRRFDRPEARNDGLAHCEHTSKERGFLRSAGCPGRERSGASTGKVSQAARRRVKQIGRQVSTVQD